ncbi:unnamed protein product [Owenia fusiformis]|uniref:Uncharacterized protein n=1 Tax=Owenia fusiformis TaxID=6347 RepID=A0A8J1TUT9_OWEFU|nr:unnamed protein product [Owenia fusiformis]
MLDKTTFPRIVRRKTPYKLQMATDIVYPTGNWVAGSLKKWHDFSSSVLPASDVQACMENEKDKAEKYHSIYEATYGPKVMMITKDRPELLGANIKTNFQASSLAPPASRPNPNVTIHGANKKMFMNWRVPQRLVEDGVGPQSVPQNNPTKRASSQMSCSQPASIRREKTMFPEIPVTHNMPSTDSPKRFDAVIGNGPPKRNFSKESIGMNTINKEVSSLHLNDPDIPRPEKWMKTRRTPEPVERRTRVAKIGVTSIKPETKLAVDKWMETATEDEKAEAIRFLRHTAAGKKLMGAVGEEQKERLGQVLHSLKSGTKGGEHIFKSQVKQKPDGYTTLNYVRLLTPETRSNKFMMKSWHHLPQYKETNPVINRTSMYTQPQGYIPRHYVIHPDLG